MWGTGASSTQTEGAAPRADWARWEAMGRVPASGDGNGFATHYRDDPALANVRVLQSIHNLAHPGCFQTHTLQELGLARELAA